MAPVRLRMPGRTNSSGDWDFGRYVPLKAFLAELPHEQVQTCLTFDRIREILGFELPTTAKNSLSWWRHSPTLNSVVSLSEYGWDVEQLYPAVGVVVFRRPNTDMAAAIRGYVKAVLGQSSHVQRLDAGRLSRWIRICKQLGWYFEATVLYEHSGGVLSATDDEEIIGAEEDYQVCKRELNRDVPTENG